jgi:hypothetical protein
VTIHEIPLQTSMHFLLAEKGRELWLFIIICPNLREFEYVIIREHLWDLPDQIKNWIFNHLSGQVSLISNIS